MKRFFLAIKCFVNVLKNKPFAYDTSKDTTITLFKQEEFECDPAKFIDYPLVNGQVEILYPFANDYFSIAILDADTAAKVLRALKTGTFCDDDCEYMPYVAKQSPYED